MPVSSTVSERSVDVNQYDDLVTAYLQHAAESISGGKDQPLSDAWVRLDNLVRDEPEAAWPVVLELVRRARQDDVLAYIAAGPLEDLLCRHPHAFIDRVEALGRRDPHFRRALSGVWGFSTMPADVWNRLEVLLKDEDRL